MLGVFLGLSITKSTAPRLGAGKPLLPSPLSGQGPAQGPAATEPAWSLWGRTALKLPFELVR